LVTKKKKKKKKKKSVITNEFDICVITTFSKCPHDYLRLQNKKYTRDAILVDYYFSANNKNYFLPLPLPLPLPLAAAPPAAPPSSFGNRFMLFVGASSTNKASKFNDSGKM
tara:strand:+ start:177 stop:509 length:333 start_codon:yes stop_codon:yes gene_type:complete